MPFKYVMKWQRAPEKEKLTIEAWYRHPETKQEKKKPAFQIGSIEGSRVIILRDRIESIISSYGSKRYGQTIRVQFPLDETKAIADAYRLGLAAAVLTHAPDNESLQRASVYVMDMTDEEVWFWTSKLLNVNVGPKRTISALCIVSGAWGIPKPGKKIVMRPSPHMQADLAKFGGKKG